jgi:uncharacterized protein (DUF1501 family)
MSISRRSFLRTGALGLGASTLLSSFERFGLGPALASASIDPSYQAIVIVFLFGGNDSNNMLIPNDVAGRYDYAKYAAVRKPSTCDFSIPQSGTGAGLGIQPQNLTSPFMLHPSMTNLAGLFNATTSPLAILCNTGSLVEPSKKSASRAVATDPTLVQPGTTTAAVAPTHLMSHLDQQSQWQASIANPSAATALTGWGGRVADQYPTVPFPTVLSDDGATLFTQGSVVDPMVVAPSGVFGLQDTGGNAAFVQTLAGQTSGVVLTRANQAIMNQARLYSDKLSNAIAASSVSWGTTWANTGTLGTALHRIADVIAASGPGTGGSGLGMTKQIFFCGLGGFDTHAGQGATQASLYTQIDAALFAFYTAMGMIGAQDKVVLATHSDFGRTLKPASSTGTDHAWGSHHLILGGPVKGGKLYGTFPDLTLGGADDMDGDLLKPGGEGRWVPTRSVDQYAATLAGWLDPALTTTALFPNLVNFSQQKLGFL